MSVKGSRCVCVCVCVCASERGNVSERARQKKVHVREQEGEVISRGAWLVGGGMKE